MESGLPNLIKLDDYLIEKYPNDPNRRVKSARIDSGDLARGSKRLRKALDAAGKPISSWWLPMVWTSGRSPTWSSMSTLILIPTAWARISSPPLLTLCSAACINWWQSSCRMAPISQDEVLGFCQQGHHPGKKMPGGSTMKMVRPSAI